MAKTSRVLALDIGAASIKLAEFAYGAGNSVTMLSFDYREYGEELSEDTRGFVIGSLLGEMVRAGGYDTRKALVSISGQYALTRFVPLPPVAEEESRVRQIVEFEARQNVPFPMNEVIWDYQLISNPSADELEVMFVVIKNEIVEEITAAVQFAGLEPVLVDVAPAACYNAARANLIGDEECAMILNLGDRSTNLLFADKQQFFARTIPIAGHSISQQIAKEFGMPFDKAEELKRRHGFVALGGAYAEPDSEVAASVSKIVRNVMTRLHGEINRSIGVYRAQQKGRKPQKLYLTGGSSIMGFTDRFFEDKLGIPVEYLNPFQCVQMGPAIDVERLQNVAHTFSEVVGLGLRYRGRCAVEVSLMPISIVRQIAMRRRQPYFMACAAAIVLMLLVTWLALAQKNRVYEDLVMRSSPIKERLEDTRRGIEQQVSNANQQLAQYEYLENLVASREQLPRALNTIEAMKPPDVWLTRVDPVTSARDDGLRLSGADDRLPFAGGPPDAFGGFGLATPESGDRLPAERERRRIEVEELTIVGFIIEGNSIELPTSDLRHFKAAASGESPVAPAVPVPAGDLGPPTNGGETAVEDAAPPPIEGDEAKVAVTPETLVDDSGLMPAEQLQKRLKEHPLFKADETAFITYTTVSTVANMKRFTMRVTLVEPIKVPFK